MLVRIPTRVPRHFRNGIERALRCRVVAQYAVALAHLFQCADRVRFPSGAVPHFLALYEKRVPVVVVWVGAKDPVVSLRGRNCHRGFESALYIGYDEKAKQNVRVSAFSKEFSPETGKNGLQL